MATFNKVAASLEEAKDIIEVYFKMMSPEDRRNWWNDEDDYPLDKIEELVKELMPDYTIDYFVDHQEGDADLIPCVIRSVMDTVNGKKVIDFQYADFWFNEMYHSRVYFTAIKTK